VFLNPRQSELEIVVPKGQDEATARSGHQSTQRLPERLESRVLEHPIELAGRAVRIKVTGAGLSQEVYGVTVYAETYPLIAVEPDEPVDQGSEEPTLPKYLEAR